MSRPAQAHHPPAPAAHAAAGTLTAARLREAVAAVPAPDVVFAVSHRGRRTLVAGGTRPYPPGDRRALRYEIGSATKTFTGLLFAALADDGLLAAGDPLDTRLPAAVRARAGDPAHPVTLLHALTHTSGLPRLPRDFYPHALPRWRVNPYAGYGRRRLLDAYRRTRPRRAPGTRWHYSNFAVSVLGHALAHTVGSPYGELLTRRVLHPLGLAGTALCAAGPDRDATGHAADGRTPLPPAELAGFTPAGAVRATPDDLLAFLEAHVRPGDGPAAGRLSGALAEVQRPVLRRGAGHRHLHTLTWFRQPSPYGPVCFHAGATPGQEAFLGYRPATGTAVVGLATRRFAARTSLVPVAHALLTELPAERTE
ncbi:serine hydrolase [Streptomyces sp. JJ36]|uniref:serine hydrolase domain-containing protein n=1 Tax=Streptomyces sp. JJ36 TaxID=2736645 RepID=UPI001F4333C7|nr:serine hydrolase domain-containing protein [Streptomyces sp. JJ36]MCF6523354.1 beta-lactamase family protein [Streptomyces sp. JJ36]